jgi:hypothetical protein
VLTEAMCTQKSSVVVYEAGVSRMCSGRGSFHRKIQVKSSHGACTMQPDARGRARRCALVSVSSLVCSPAGYVCSRGLSTHGWTLEDRVGSINVRREFDAKSWFSFSFVCRKCRNAVLGTSFMPSYVLDV